MSAPKHTPGPWNRNIKPAKKYATIYAGRNTHVCHLSVSGLTDEEIEGNCNLIAAAPDLLNALQGVMDWWLTAPRPKGRGFSGSHQMNDTGAEEMPRDLFDAALLALEKAKEEELR